MQLWWSTLVEPSSAVVIHLYRVVHDNHNCKDFLMPSCPLETSLWRCALTEYLCLHEFVKNIRTVLIIYHGRSMSRHASSWKCAIGPCQPPYNPIHTQGKVMEVHLIVWILRSRPLYSIVLAANNICSAFPVAEVLFICFHPHTNYAAHTLAFSRNWFLPQWSNRELTEAAHIGTEA